MRVFCFLALAGTALAQVNFDNLPAGTVPPNWTRVETHAGMARLQVHRDPSAPSRPNVFAESGSGPHDAGFPLLYDKVVCRDGDLSVKFRISPGRPDQTAGIVFRYQDARNYYLLNFSVDHKSIGLMRVNNGLSEALPARGQHDPKGFSHDLRAGQWYVAKVVFRGTKVRVLFGNRQLFEVQDSRLQGSGKTGVWTRGQTEASFDDFRIDRKG
jgi:hypothetical protein